MRSLRALVARLRGLRHASREGDDISDELAAHVAMHTEDNIRAGMAPAEARRRALLQLGGAEQTAQAMRDRRTVPLLEDLLHDLRFSLRQLRSHPGFTVTAIVMLALGIGSSVAIFSFVDAALIQPLPFYQPNRLVATTEVVDRMGPANLSWPDYLDWQRGSTDVYQSFAAWSADGYLLGTASGVESVRGMVVTANFFRTLGVSPMLGRDFHDGEDAPGAAPAAMLSYGGWQQYFGSREDVAGSLIRLNGKAYTLVGVLPRSFSFAPRGRGVVWTTVNPAGACEKRRSCHNLIGVARLRDGVTVGMADQRVKQIARDLQLQYPDSNRGQGGMAAPLAEQFTGWVRPILLTLLTGAALLLLISCTNVASLLLARADGRRREFALRGALGATTARLLRQFATESFVLVLAGGVAGLLAAFAAMRLLLRLVPERMMQSMPYLSAAGIKAHVLAFSAAVLFLAFALFAVIPTLRVSAGRLRTGLATDTSGAGSLTWRRFGSHLVVLELATTVVLLVGAGLLTRSLYRLLQVDLGFRSEGVASLGVFMSGPQLSTDEQQIAMQHRIVDRVAALPGVEAAAASNLLPVTSSGNTDWIRFAGRPYDGNHIEVLQRESTPAYFSTMGAKLVRGRYFTDADAMGKPLVTIINRSLAKQYFPGEDPIGKQFGDTALSPASMKTIVGVIDDVREGPLDSQDLAAVYYPAWQNVDGYIHIVARISGDPAALLPTLAATVRAVDRNGLAIDEIMSMDDRIRDQQSTALHRGAAWLVGAFAVIALLLSAIGLYGVIAYSVSQRTREIGVRMALGAQRGSVYRLILREAAALGVAGLGIGLVLAVAAATLMHDLLFGVPTWDLPTLGTVVLVLGAAAMLASYLPARRAASVNPTEALRAE